MVWRLDRLGRSLRHLIDVVTALGERGVGFRSLRKNIDTTTAGGRLVCSPMFGGAGPGRAGDAWVLRRSSPGSPAARTAVSSPMQCSTGLELLPRSQTIVYGPPWTVPVGAPLLRRDAGQGYRDADLSTRPRVVASVIACRWTFGLWDGAGDGDERR